ncbi:transposase [Belnapia sp. T18]|uniref:Transposase n=1 Tax=Belnapia arida TaxID=2804533 RepID=A0ABS1UCU0_9PROT|nr:transposase [Belnapia arida]
MAGQHPRHRGIGATALAAVVSNPQDFAPVRHFAASLGLTPKPHSSGGKERLGWICCSFALTRRGHSHVRRDPHRARQRFQCRDPA